MSEPKIYQLTLAEAELNKASEHDPNLWATYWLEKPGIPPFQFDKNFTDKGKWQVAAVMAKQPLIIAICGISTGKTLAMGLGACYHASITQDFRFFNVGKELEQAKIMYDLILEYTAGTRFEKLIYKKPASPHPKIVIEYMIGNVVFSSTLMFYSAGELSGGENLFSLRGDWFNIEEAWRFPDLSTLVERLTTRGTGATSHGRPYMGRLSIISNPLDNPDLWAIYENAKMDPEHCATFLIDTVENKNNTDEQIATQLRNIPEEERDYYLRGKRPEGRGSYFSRSIIESCEREELLVDLKKNINLGTPGYHGEFHPALGYWHYRFPRDPNHSYIIVSDPGTGAAPARNAPVIQVIDVTEAPKLNFISAMWWGNGAGSIMPWVEHLLEFITIYCPVFVGIDSTATQKYTAELFNSMYIVGKHYSVPGVTGLDFSGSGKYSYLISLRLSLSAGSFYWPKGTGIGTQLRSYDPTEDTSRSSKIPQDLVATLSMGAFASRALFPPIGEENQDEQPKNNKHSRSFGIERYRSANRNSTVARTPR